MGHVLKRDWTTCLEFIFHSRRNSQHNVGGVGRGGGGYMII